MDIIWRWATSIALIMLSLQFVPGCGVETVRDSVLVAIFITLLHAGLKRALLNAKIAYSAFVLFIILLIANVLIFSALSLFVPLIYIVDMTSGLIVLGFVTVVGWMVQVVPPLTDEADAPKKKKVLR